MELRNTESESPIEEGKPSLTLDSAKLSSTASESTVEDEIGSDISYQTAKEIARQRRNMRWLFGTLAIPLLLAIAYQLSLFQLPIDPTTFIELLVLLLAGPSFLAIFLLRDCFRLNSLANKAEQLDDIDAVGALIDLLSVENKALRTSAVTALIRLLPQLQPEHANLLNRSQRTRLTRILNLNPETILYKDLGAFLDVGTLLKPAEQEQEKYRRATDIRVAILQAYEHIGGAKELSVVRKLANITPDSPASKRLSSAAKEVLPAVEQRAEAERNHGALLRPMGGK